jgi:hypothetical protein
MLDRLLLVGLATALVYAITRIRYARLEQFKKLPQLKPSPVWGHLSAFNGFLKQCRPDCHSDEVFAQIRNELGNPPVLMMDLRPITYPILIISTHEAAERVTKSTKLFPWSVPKSPTMKGLQHLVGPLSLLTKDVSFLPLSESRMLVPNGSRTKNGSRSAKCSTPASHRAI